jgi:hypothetical protein
MLQMTGDIRIAHPYQKHGARTWYERTTGGSDQVVLKRERSSGGACRHAELGEDILEVAADCVVADNQRGRNLAVRLASRDEAEYLHFARGQPAGFL